MGFIKKALENLVKDQLPAPMSNSLTNNDNDRKRRFYLRMKVIAEFTVQLENPKLTEEIRNELETSLNSDHNYLRNVHRPTANELNAYVWESDGISGANKSFEQLLTEFVSKCRAERELDQQPGN